MSQLLSLEELVDGQSFSRFNLMILIWSFLALLADGFDLAALASAAPALGRAWHIARADFAPALSASVFGILLGAPLLGVAGDRYGRKPAILASCVVYSLSTLAVVWARNLDQVMILRALAGIGLGGLMPNLIALNSEFAPRRLRATLVVLMFAGISVGGGLPGAVQAWLIPKFGWQIMFWIGGLAPLALDGCIAVLAAGVGEVSCAANGAARRTDRDRSSHAPRPLDRGRCAIQVCTHFSRRFGTPADFQRIPGVDHAVDVGMLCKRAHGQLLSQQLAAARPRR